MVDNLFGLPCPLDRHNFLRCGCQDENLVSICDASYWHWLGVSLIWSFNAESRVLPLVLRFLLPPQLQFSLE
jgi:hypothetical protein